MLAGVPGLMHITRRLSFVSSALLSLTLFACGSSLSYEPLNTKLQTQLPSLHADGLSADDPRIFSFRIITPTEHVDLFSILQTADPITPNQKTLPVGQLKAVQLAAEKINSSEFLKPEEATVLAFETAQMFNWDLEISRQVLVEVVRIYTSHRDAEVKKFREMAEERAQFFIAKNKRAQDEYNKQAKAVIDRYFGGIPNPQPVSYEEQLKRREIYTREMQQRIEKNKRAQDEYNRQNKAALDKYLAQLDEQTKKAREKDQQAQKIREAQLDNLIGSQKLTAPADFALKAQAGEQPYSLLALTNGDFMLEARQALPAVIQLEVAPFKDPIAIPVLPQTSHGRLLVSITQDAQGRPLVYGGMDASSGARFDLEDVLFSVRFDQQGQQQLEFVYPDGRTQSMSIAELQNLNSETALNQLQPLEGKLELPNLQARKDLYGQIRYQLTPELEYLPPQQALEVLESIKNSV